MNDEENLYKRKDDQQWRDDVNSRLVSLTAAQKNTDDDIDELARKIEEFDELLHGDRRERDSGLVGQLNAIETALNAVLRILHPDNLGKGGLINEHNALRDEVLGRKKSSEYTWKNWTAIVVAAIGAIALLVQQWPTISDYWRKEMKAQGQVHREVQRAKTRRRVVPVIKVVPAPKQDAQQIEPEP